MSDAAAMMPVTAPLRVAVSAADPARRARLQRILAASGHEIAVVPSEADIILSDGPIAIAADRPVVSLGGGDDGQAGLLPPEIDAAQIDAALRAVAAGLIVRAPEATAGFRALPEPPLQTLLTPRELEIVAAIGDGLTNKLIARRLGISLHTVKFHMESVFRKLGARTRTEVLAKASQRRRSETAEL